MVQILDSIRNIRLMISIFEGALKIYVFWIITVCIESGSRPFVESESVEAFVESESDPDSDPGF